MSLHNEDVDVLIKENFVEMQEHINAIEMELLKPEEERNLAVIALANGKMSKLFASVAFMMGIFDNNPKNVGR